jgi:Ca2+-binding EF-hand superfamily protein
MQVASFVKDEIEEMFDRIDTDGDRNISFDEFSDLMRDMDRSQSTAQLQASFDAIDSDRDGFVSFDEFCAWIIR